MNPTQTKPETTSRSRHAHLNSIQCMRAVAAFMVMFGHSLSEISYYHGVNLLNFPIPWVSGVDIFFVISGFVIALATAKVQASGQSSWHFLKARIIRLVPAYYFFTSLTVILLFIKPGYFNSAAFDGGHIVSSYLFIPAKRPDGLIVPPLSVGRTLNYEMFFYVLVAALMLSPRRFFAPLTIALLPLIVGLGMLFPQKTTALHFWSNAVLLEFAAGFILGYIYLRNDAWRQNLPAWLPITTFLIGSLMLVLLYQIIERPWHRSVSFGVPAAVMVAAITVLMPDRLDKKLPSWIVVLGDSSYLLYLSHRFTLRLVSFFWLSVMPSGPIWLSLSLTVTALACLIVALVLHLYIEKPVLGYLRNRFL